MVDGSFSENNHLIKAKLGGRRSIRLPKYDYAQSGAYFVTICTLNQIPILGRIDGGEIILFQEGKIVVKCMEKIHRHFTNASLDSYVIIPNHIHMIVILSRSEASAFGSSGTILPSFTDASPLQPNARPRGTKKGSLGAIIQNFKSVSTCKINHFHSTPGKRIWQRKTFEHIYYPNRKSFERDSPVHDDQTNCMGTGPIQSRCSRIR